MKFICSIIRSFPILYTFPSILARYVLFKRESSWNCPSSISVRNEHFCGSCMGGYHTATFVSNFPLSTAMYLITAINLSFYRIDYSCIPANIADSSNSSSILPASDPSSNSSGFCCTNDFVSAFIFVFTAFFVVSFSIFC